MEHCGVLDFSLVSFVRARSHRTRTRSQVRPRTSDRETSMAREIPFVLQIIHHSGVQIQSGWHAYIPTWRRRPHVMVPAEGNVQRFCIGQVETGFVLEEKKFRHLRGGIEAACIILPLSRPNGQDNSHPKNITSCPMDMLHASCCPCQCAFTHTPFHRSFIIMASKVCLCIALAFVTSGPGRWEQVCRR
jgi:hypothetical protein